VAFETRVDAGAASYAARRADIDEETP